MRHAFATLVLCICVAASALAQSSAKPSLPDPDAPSLLSEVPTVPGLATRLHGLNAGITIAGVHDSSTGWYTLFIPAGSLSFSRHYSFDVSMPVYFYRLAETTVTTSNPAAPGRMTYATTLQSRTWDAGDVVLAVHSDLVTRRLRNEFTPSMTLPTGDTDSGLGTGRATFDIDNHTQFNIRRGAVLLDLGGGDSSTLVNRLVTKDYTSLGPLAHFQFGLLTPFVGHITFQSVAYEQLPLGDSKLYATITRRGYPDRTVVTGRSVSEDNGFTNSVAVPLSPHLTLQGYYNRSLRLHLDTAAMSLTWVWRGYKHPTPESYLSGSLLQK